MEGVFNIKKIYISFIVFIALIFAAFFSIKYLKFVCDKLTKLDSTVEEYVNNDNWQEANKASIECLESWKNYSDKISVFVNHAEIDNINMELYKLTQYVKTEDKEESLASINALKFLLEHIVNLEKINLQNIF